MIVPNFQKLKILTFFGHFNNLIAPCHKLVWYAHHVQNHIFNFLYYVHKFYKFLGQVGDKLYIYLEYVSGGSIFKLLGDYGKFGELAIRSYTQQILSGLAYLHAKNTVHR